MTATEPNAVTITVDGQLLDHSVEAVDTRVKQAIGLGRAVRLFLRDITDIDQNGRALLSRLAMDGVHLSAGGSELRVLGLSALKSSYDENH